MQFSIPKIQRIIWFRLNFFRFKIIEFKMFPIFKFFSYKFSVLALTYVAYTCYHLTRKPISVVKAVLHRNCSSVEISQQVKSITDASDETWCDYPPFGKLCVKQLLYYYESFIRCIIFWAGTKYIHMEYRVRQPIKVNNWSLKAWWWRCV